MTRNVPDMNLSRIPWTTNQRSPHWLLPMLMSIPPKVGGHWSPPTYLIPDQQDATSNSTFLSPNLFGDHIHTKSTHHFCGVSCQLVCLPIDPDDSKHEGLASPISAYQADATALQEIGLNFSYCGIQGQWKSRMGYNKWFDAHSDKHVLAWNKTDPCCSCCQWGSTAIMAVGQTTHYAAGSDVDPTNLGRWCWTHYQGSNSIIFQFYSVYRPSDNTSGQLSVYAQHQWYFLDQGDAQNPRAAFLQDLAMDITIAIMAGEMIIVCGDVNQDVNGNTITSYFASLGLHHLLFLRHLPTTAPATYNWNTTQTSVDGVWASINLNLIRGGYLDFGDFLATPALFGLTFPSPSSLVNT